MAQLTLGRPPPVVVEPGRSPGLTQLLTRTSLVPLLALAVMASLTRSAGIDDAYISYRYASNFAAGHGLVFNAGEHVEGISNLVWTLLLVPFARIGLSLPGVGYALGLLFLAVAVVLVRRLAGAVGLPPLAAVGVAAATALTSDFVAGATMGLEGGLYAALMLAALLAWTELERSGVLFATLALALAFTRPEGMCVALLLAAACLLKRDEQRRARIRAAVLTLGFIAAGEVFRLAYFHALVPNSVTAKRDIGLSATESLRQHAPAGLRYLWSGIGHVLVVSAVSVVVSAAVLMSRAERKLPLVLIPMVATLGVGLALPIASGGDWMPYARLVTPYLPILYTLTAYLTFATGCRYALAAATLVPFAFAAVAPHDLPLRDGGRNPLTADAGFDSLGRAVAQAGLQDRVVATDVLGRLSFHAPQVRVEDVLGLTDPVIARTAGPGSVYGKHNFRRVADTRPALVASNYWPALRAYLGASKDRTYVAMVSPSLTRHRVFVIAEPEEAARVVSALGDPEAHVEPVTPALSGWRKRYPGGQ